MRLISFAICAALAANTSLALAQGQPANQAPAAAPAAKYSSTTTSLGTLMADPAAKAVLEKNIPDFINRSDTLDRASGMTLKEIQEAIQAYAPDALSDKILAQIDQDLAKLPAKN